MLNPDTTGNDTYKPGSLLPDPKPYEGPQFDVRDYLLDEYYVGTDENGLPNLDDFVVMAETGIVIVPDMDERIEKRGFREKLDRFENSYDDERLRNGVDMRITSVDLWADMTWEDNELEYDTDLKDNLKEKERLIASVKKGDVLELHLLDVDDRVKVTFLNSADETELPFSPYHDYDQLEFEKLMPLAKDGWVLSCYVKDIEVFGGNCAPADPECQWRVCRVIADVCGHPGSLTEEDELSYELRGGIDAAELNQAINEMFSGLEIFVRDANLELDKIAKYEIGSIIREREYADASARIGGMVCSCRFSILSNHIADFSEYEHDTNWGLHVANRDSHFKVLDVFEDEGKTQILLLHLLDDYRWRLFESTELDIYQDLVAEYRERFLAIAHDDEIPELTKTDWIDRCAAPLGFDDEWCPYELEVNLEEKLVIFSELSWRLVVGRAFYIRSKKACSILEETDIRLSGNYDGVICWGYLDDECGLSLRVLSPARIDGEKIICGDPLDNASLILRACAVEKDMCIEAMGVNLEVFREQIIMDKEYAPDKELVETRQIEIIDPLRNAWHPDDVSVLIIAKKKATEQVWARLKRIGDNCLESMLLNEPNQDFPVHVGDILQMKLAHTDEGNLVLVAVF